MSNCNREEILADFQACTGIEDVAESILHLEESNWNLLVAVNNVMPQDVGMSETASGVHGVIENRSVTTTTEAPVVMSEDIRIIPSTSDSSKVLTFTIEYGTNQIPLTVSERETIGTIKSLIHSQLGIRPCRQELLGWTTADITDSTRLSSLNLPRENSLFLVLKDKSAADDDDDYALSDAEKALRGRLALTFQLKITNSNNKKEFVLNYSGTKTVQQVREDVFALTDIPVRHQLWTGWPVGSNEDGATLASCGILHPCQELTVESRNTNSSTASQGKPLVVDVPNEISTSSEEFEDASETFGSEDEIFMQDIPTRRLRPLMPDNVTNELDCVGSFVTEFRARYGSDHVAFYHGTLDDALKEAFQKPAKERKLLGIYLHHDGSVLANVFCTQLLCSETVTSYLAANFLMWGWDMTHDCNRARLLSMVMHHFGHVASTTIKNFAVDQLPILMVIMRVRSTTEVFTVLHGDVGLDELLTRLIQAVEVFSGQQKIEILEEDHRVAREKVKREQDEAYEASLLADRAKEEARRLEEEEKQRVIWKQQCEQEREEQIRMKEEAAKTAFRQSLERQLPDEPSETSFLSTCHIRMRLPTSEVISRRFRATDTLQVLFDFLTVKGYSGKDYKVLASWPRVDLTLMNPQHSFQKLNLCPQETVTLEER